MKRKSSWIITMFVGGITHDQYYNYNKKIYKNIDGFSHDSPNKTLSLYRNEKLILTIIYTINDLIEIRDKNSIKDEFYLNKIKYTLSKHIQHMGFWDHLVCAVLFPW